MNLRLVSAIVVVGLLWAVSTLAAAGGPPRIADISNTRHNFSATIAPAGLERRASAVSESQICAFCHTPHGATPETNAPIWNRQLSQATYIPFDSTSIDATDLGQPTGRSKLCLSCHDGTIALGSVNVLNRQVDTTIPMTGTSPGGAIPEGTGRQTGFTRYLGIDLTNDHPISFTYDTSQAVRDGELFDPAVVSWVGERTRGSAVAMPHGDYLPLERDADGSGPKLECITCHDPHIRSEVPGENIKFLRANRFQVQGPAQGQFDPQRDIICLACHDKDGWADSAHANPAVAIQRYTDAAADIREFPRNIQVWQAACLNCHDLHTVQGARRLLREGTDGPLLTDPETGGQFRQGGRPAVEMVCYSCHGDPVVGPPTAQTLQGQISPNTNPAFEVPDIKTDFTTLARHMPISSDDQLAGQEVHSIGTGNAATQGDQRGQDFVEARGLLGLDGLQNRHAECTDCHNPHRVIRNNRFNDDPTVPGPAATHAHGPGIMPENIASGVLRGIWGVEPVYASTRFGQNPIDFDVKRGDPGVGGSEDTSAPYLTREYQLCLKCHSNYAYETPPPLGYTSGLTPPGTPSTPPDMLNYTNQAMEFQSPPDHVSGLTRATPTGAYDDGAACTVELTDSNNNPVIVNGHLDPQGNCVDFRTNNHRSWHPVMRPTGRTPAERGANPDVWRQPFNAFVGTQTMFCSDCHGSRTMGNTVVPMGGEQGAPWGPHGSNENFILKGNWSNQTGTLTTNFANESDPNNHLCFRCHDPKNYARSVLAPNPDVFASGFRRAVGGGGCLQFLGVNLHIGHAAVVDNFRCTYCHVSIPHGWKNKAFLVNLNDIGLESEMAPGTQVRYQGFAPTGTGRFYRAPYYNGAALKVRNFARSGEWLDAHCGSAGDPSQLAPNLLVGVEWMMNSNEACINLP